MKKNIVLIIGIFVYSISIFSSHIFSRSYELQFHTISLHKKLDYNRLSRSDIDKIVYIVFKDDRGNGGVYFKNTQFHTITPALENLIAEFDFQRLQLCAWMIARDFKWVENTDWFDYRYNDGTRRMVRKFDIFNPEVVQKIITVYKELAAKKINAHPGRSGIKT